MKPKFTDLARYPRGYRKAVETDIAATFRRIKDERKANAAEAQQKLRTLKRSA